MLPNHVISVPAKLIFQVQFGIFLAKLYIVSCVSSVFACHDGTHWLCFCSEPGRDHPVLANIYLSGVLSQRRNYLGGILTTCTGREAAGQRLAGRSQ